MGRKKSGLERIVGALTAAAVLGGLYAFHILTSPGWLIGLTVFFVAIPFLTGVRRVVREIEDGRHERLEARRSEAARLADHADSIEKTVLTLAQRRGGVVTPALLVLETDLKLEEAEKILGSLAARGYAEMRVKDNGTIDYLFHDLA